MRTLSFFQNFLTRTTTVLPVALLAGLTLGACAKDALTNDEGDPSGESAPKRPVQLILETPSAVSLDFAEQSTIVARVLWEDNTPAAERSVHFTISGTSGGSSLLAPSALTGLDGRASNTLTAGQDKVSYSVVITTLQNDGSTLQKTVNVVVDGLYVGDLRVKYDYNGVIPLSNIRTFVHKATVNCPGIDYAALPPRVDEDVAANAAAMLTFTDLEENTVYSVTAIAMGPAGNDVATGCAVATPIVGRGSVLVTIPLQLKQIEVIGVYDFGSELHLDEALPGTEGDLSTARGIIHFVQDLFFDPGLTLGNFLITQLADWTDESEGTIRNYITAGWSVFVLIGNRDINGDGSVNTLDVDQDSPPNGSTDDVLDYYIFDRAPQWVNDAFTIGGDLSTLLTDLTVGGKMEIETHAATTGAITGHWDWSDFLFMWRVGLGCDISNACCGRTTYDGDAVGLAPIGADWDGDLTARTNLARIEYDMVIEEHPLAIQYGNLILFALNQFVLPALTGQNSIPCAAESMFGCNDGGTFDCAAANRSTNPSASCGCPRAGEWLEDTVGLSAGAGNTVCTMAVSAAAEMITETLQGLTFSGTNNAYFDMNLAGVLADADQDLHTDKLEQAELTGTLHVGTSANAFTGELRAEIERTLCAADNECTTAQSCQMQLDVLDDCKGRQVCVRRIGDRLADQTCNANTQCASGVCLAAGRCFTTCTDDNDCPGNLGCDAGAATIALTTTVSVPANACLP